MQLSNVPDKLVLPWATAGNKNAIPVASQIGITAGAASLTDGFPPLTMTPIAAGGVAPSGLDMNGILFEMSAILRWANAGGGYVYDGTFAADSNVGGYPKGARLLRSDGLGYWFNTVENNTTDPEDAGAVAAGWVPDFAPGITSISMTNANVTLTPLQYGKRVVVITGTLVADLNLILPAIAGQCWAVINGTSGGYTVTAKTAGGTGVIVYGASQVYCDGTNIAHMGVSSSAVNFVAAGSGAVPQTSQTKLRQIVSVEDYGGSPSASAATNAAALVAAQAALSTGGILWFGNAGTYDKSGTHRLRRELTLKGQGPGITKIRQTTDVTAFAMDETADAALVRDIQIEDMTITKQTPSGTSGVYGISLTGTSNNVWGCRIHKVHVDGFYDGINIARPILTVVEQCESHNNARDGIRCTGSGTSLTLRNNYCYQNAGHGYNVLGSLSYTTLDTNASDQNSLCGYYIGDPGSNYPTGLTLIANGAESNAQAGFRLVNSEDVAILGGIAYANGVNGYDILGARGITLVGVKALSNTGYGVSAGASSGGALNRNASTVLAIGCGWTGNTVGRLNDNTLITDLAAPDTNSFDFARLLNSLGGFAVNGTTVIGNDRKIQNLGLGSETYHWIKRTLSYTDFAAASTTGDYIFPEQIPDKSYVVDVVFELTAEFSGGGVTAATLAIGDAGSGSFSNWIPATNVFTGAGTGAKATNVTDRGSRLYDATNKGLRMPVFGAARQFRARLTTTTANTNALTAGAVTIWVGLIKLP